MNFDSKERIVLASSSPRRRELLALCGVAFDVHNADADENCDGTPAYRVTEISHRKALACAKTYPDRLVLAGDTLVYAQGNVLGKPKDEADAFKMLKLLSGSTHQVYSGICLIDGQRGTTQEAYDVTDVTFSPLEDEVIYRYIASGEPMDKAGSYAIQGIGGMFIESIQGSYSNVIGLPLALVRKMLKVIPEFEMM